MKILRIFLALFLVTGFLHFVEPAAAAGSPKLVDHGTAYSDKSATIQFKLDWKTYMYSTNTRKIVTTIYIQKQGKWKYLGKEIITLKKSSKTTISESRINLNGCYNKPILIKSKLDIKTYYYKIFRPNIIGGNYMPIP